MSVCSFADDKQRPDMQRPDCGFNSDGFCDFLFPSTLLFSQNVYFRCKEDRHAFVGAETLSASHAFHLLQRL